jgi:FixJ family two-component response regulator
MREAKLRIAVVDDDAGMCRALGRLLTASGFQLEIFPSAEAFLHENAQEHTDCLVLDIHLGGMSGFDLQRQLTATGSRLRAVFITAHDAAGTQEEARALGSGYLHKPFTRESLVEAIQSAVAAK